MLLDLIIFFHKFFLLSLAINIFLFVFNPFHLGNIYAQEEFYGDKTTSQVRLNFNKVIVYADKGFHDFKHDKFEASGNVIISYDKNTIYGQKVVINFKTSVVTMSGNVRFVGLYNTIYSTSLILDSKKNKIEFKTARVLSENFVLLGKEIRFEDSKYIYAKDAEYTTCRDCPESWEILGSEVKVEKNEYIYIKHAYFKIKGIIAFYFPYIIFPIKKKRESGFLFPSIGSDTDNGSYLTIPWYYALNSYSDATITPLILGKAGYGLNLEYRLNYSSDKWFYLNSYLIKDNLYNPFDRNFTSKTKSSSNLNSIRQIQKIEYKLSSKMNFNHYFYADLNNDIDMYRDYDYLNNITANSITSGVKTFVESRFNLYNISIQSFYMKNLLYKDSLLFDKDFIQISPKISLMRAPFVFLNNQNDFFNKGLLSLNLDFTRFSQIKNNESVYIRNANRFNFTPSLQFNLVNLKNINIKTTLNGDFQFYNFPYQTISNNFYKGAYLLTTKASFAFYKQYGVSSIQEEAYNTKIEDNNTTQQEDILGYIPNNLKNQNKKVVLYKQIPAFIHNEAINLIHRIIKSSKNIGSPKFLKQIQDTSGNGQFDRIDSIREQEEKINAKNTKTMIPKTNSLEILWTNTLTKKIAYMSSDKTVKYNYKKYISWDISQGFKLGAINSFKDRLTRLAIFNNYYFDNFHLGISDYFFYSNRSHVLNLNYGFSLSKMNFSSSISLDPFTTPISKKVSFSWFWNYSDNLYFSNNYEYDFQMKNLINNKIVIGLKPKNKCWKMEVTYIKNLTKEQSFYMNFMINFNDNNYTSLSKK